MLKSMTGFGRASTAADGREIVVELKSVNHRYLDIGMRLPRPLGFLEEPIRGVLSKKFSRGHIDAHVNYLNTRCDAKNVALDTPLLEAYRNAAKKAAQALDLPKELSELSLKDYLRFSEILNVQAIEDDHDAIKTLCMEATTAAADALAAMRGTEGKALADDLKKRAATLGILLSAIQERAPLVVVEYQEKLRTRIEELLPGNVELDAGRLENEVAYFADHANIDEEIVRFFYHIEQCEALVVSNEPVGRKLDFIVQEMNRECNTIGSKASDMAITRAVIDAKAEIEKIREQIQNIE